VTRKCKCRVFMAELRMAFRVRRSRSLSVLNCPQSGLVRLDSARVHVYTNASSWRRLSTKVTGKVTDLVQKRGLLELGPPRVGRVGGTSSASPCSRTGG